MIFSSEKSSVFHSLFLALFFFVEGRVVKILLLVESNRNEQRLKGGKYRWQVGNRFF